MSMTALRNVNGSLRVLVSIALACLVTGCGRNVTDKDIKPISLADAKALLLDRAGAAKGIDTRTPEEFARGHIPGSLNLDLAQVPQDEHSIDPALAKYKILIVYGQDAGSAAPRAMVKRFIVSGHGDPRLFAGGVTEWVAAGLRVEKTPAGSPQ